MSRIAGVLKRAEQERGDEPPAPPDDGVKQETAASADAEVSGPWALGQAATGAHSGWPDDQLDRGAAPRRLPGPRQVPRRLGSGERERGGSNAIVRRGGGGLAAPAGGASTAIGPYGGGPFIGQPPPPGPPPLLHYWGVARRRWRTGVLLFLVVVLGVVAGLLIQTSWYTAFGLLEIRPESTGNAAPVQTLFDPSKMETDDLQTQYGILRSDTLATRVLTQMTRHGTPALPPPPFWAPYVAKLAALMPKPAGAGARTPGVPTSDEIKKFHQLLLVDPQMGSRLVAVSYAAQDANVSAMTVNAVLDNYLQMRMEEAQRTEQWLEQQLQGAQQKLEASERQLQAYVSSHGLQAVETGKGELGLMANQRLQALHDDLEKAQADRFSKQSEKEQARRLSAARDVDSPVVQNLAVRLADLRREHARLSATFREDYPAVKAVTDQIAALERDLSEESQFVVTRADKEYQAAVRREALLRGALDEQNRIVQALGEQPGGRPGYEALTRDLVTNQEQFTLLNQKLKDVGVAAKLRTTNVGVVDRARPPITPDGLPLPLTLALAVIVGVAFGAGGIVVREYLDTSVRTMADLESLGVVALGAIPAVGGRVKRLPPSGALVPSRQWRRIDDRGEQQSPLAEAFAALRSAVLVSDNAAASSRVLMVTSAVPAEGKTTISINLALSLARLNYRVLLVDANLRFPCVQQALGLPDKPGLADHLASGGDWHASLHRAVRANLDVLAGTRPQTSPADLLSLPPLGHILDEAASEYEFVVLDSTAMLSHPADVHSLAAVVDDVLFTVRQGTTSREAVVAALSQLDRVSGVVLNRSTRPDGGFVWHEIPASIARVES